ncbi:T9SS type A sorting domain-containing protein [Dyadobacter arcticus]|uniref:Secretion system C-terminal sorting domain-containing protein n=1 Tax=Dyadobacter arcticus TaxID=1078754 RepID=A0ABX0UJP7_9BACT|nr:T9SS type A sorting domain-containing protein [Dyadobacter arcticus]NIJ53236.1 hypothetical protein [Dyadobacter arcticus]
MSLKFFTILLFCHTSIKLFGQIEIKFPPVRMVYQRNTSGNATVFITGTYVASIDHVQARLKTRVGEPGSQVSWTPIAGNVDGHVFGGSLTASGGRYDLEVRGMKNGQQVGNSVTVEKVGVGEVFLIVGHSNADAANSAMVGANNDMVNSINIRSDWPLHETYLTTGSPNDLQPLQPSQLCQTCGIGPMAGYPWLWSRLGDLLTSQSGLNVPVLFYSAAFGGSNMEQTYQAAYDIPFAHGFINYSIRMPYVNIRNTLSKYAPQTGLRAILSMHGVNDQNTDGEGFKFRSLKVIEKTREESQYQQLPWMVATSCYNHNGVNQSITAGQESLIATVPYVFRGANLNSIGDDGRYDQLHFNEFGQSEAARLWKEAIMDPVVNVLQNAQPLMAKAPSLPGPPLPVTLVNFNGKNTEDGHNQLRWTTSDESNNDYFEIQKSSDAVVFKPIGTVIGWGNSKENHSYSFSDESISKNLTYYRLNQVDFDGTATLSRIIAIRNQNENADDFVFPNPTIHSIEVATDNGAVVEDMTLFDLAGHAILQKSKSSQMDISTLNRGDYMIEIKLSSGEAIRKKIVKM